MDNRHEFIRHMMLLEDMAEQSQSEVKDEKQEGVIRQRGGGCPGVRVLPDDYDEWE